MISVFHLVGHFLLIIHDHHHLDDLDSDEVDDDDEYDKDGNWELDVVIIFHIAQSTSQ